MARYLKNPKTGRIYIATDPLKKRGDMVECAAPPKPGNTQRKVEVKADKPKDDKPQDEGTDKSTDEGNNEDTVEGVDADLIARIEESEDADELRGIAKAHFDVNLPGTITKVDTLRNKVLVMAREG